MDPETIDFIQKGLMACGLLGSVIAIFQLLTTVIGSEFTAILETESSEVIAERKWYHFWDQLRGRGMFGFLVGFGWGGALILQKTASIPVALSLGALSGVVIGLALALLMRALYGLRSEGALVLENAVGESATVFQRIPASSRGVGKVQVVFNGRISTIGACTSAGKDLLPGQAVRVVAVRPDRILEVQA